jgi:hypothetical protein
MISGKTIIVSLSCLWLLSACSVKESVQIKTQDISRQPTTIKSDGLPDKHLISTSFVPQAPEKVWDQPWQDACEEAALLTVDYYYRGVTTDIPTLLADYQKMFDFESTQSWTHDVTLTQMATISAKLLGYKTKIVEDPTIEDIKAYLAKDIPVIIPANGKILYTENKHFKSGGPWYHNLVILGYDDNKSQFTVHDVGTQFGAYFKYSYTTLMDSIHDFPDTGIKEEINDGQKQVLILLK